MVDPKAGDSPFSTKTEENNLNNLSAFGMSFVYHLQIYTVKGPGMKVFFRNFENHKIWPKVDIKI